jgi:hypothetical protein
MKWTYFIEPEHEHKQTNGSFLWFDEEKQIRQREQLAFEEIADDCILTAY